jgi:fido (protein-threonine AMPylation protein)
MSNLENALQRIREEHKHAESRVKKLDEVIRGLAGLNSSAPWRNGAGRSRTLSASARRRISLAQKARWAKVRAGKVVSIAGKRGKSTISAAGRKRIAAAQRARWAKVRAQARKAA